MSTTLKPRNAVGGRLFDFGLAFGGGDFGAPTFRCLLTNFVCQSAQIFIQ